MLENDVFLIIMGWSFLQAFAPWELKLYTLINSYSMVTVTISDISFRWISLGGECRWEKGIWVGRLLVQVCILYIILDSSL